MATFFITGANRGIGLALTQKALGAGHKVFCACRNPDGARALWEMESDFPGRVTILPLDVGQPDMSSIHMAVSHDEPIDYLINNAGVMSEFGQGLKSLDFDEVDKTLRINTLGPMRVTRALLPNLEQSRRPIIGHMSSRVGSMADNQSGGGYGYRMSKAALNMLVANMAIEFKNMTTLALHPGWVKTSMGGDNAQLGVWDSAEGLFHILITAEAKDSGRFLAYNGDEIPW